MFNLSYPIAGALSWANLPRPDGSLIVADEPPRGGYPRQGIGAIGQVFGVAEANGIKVNFGEVRSFEAFKHIQA